jgi:hypothetical protein
MEIVKVLWTRFNNGLDIQVAILSWVVKTENEIVNIGHYFELQYITHANSK